MDGEALQLVAMKDYDLAAVKVFVVVVEWAARKVAGRVDAMAFWWVAWMERCWAKNEAAWKAYTSAGLVRL